MVLINLLKVRRGLKFKDALSFIDKNNLDYPDQDALNVIFSNDWKKIDNKFNFMDLKFNKNALIIHYALSKPWSKKLTNQNSFYYNNYVSKYPLLLPFFENDYMDTKVSFLKKIMSLIYWKMKSYRNEII